MSVCPSCKKPVLPRSQNPSAPFCSERCRTVDLGNWLNEAYGVPAEEADDAPSEGGAALTENDRKNVS